jgi:hypothetical protein
MRREGSLYRHAAAPAAPGGPAVPGDLAHPAERGAWGLPAGVAPRADGDLLAAGVVPDLVGARGAPAASAVPVGPDARAGWAAPASAVPLVAAGAPAGPAAQAALYDPAGPAAQGPGRLRGIRQIRPLGRLRLLRVHRGRRQLRLHRPRWRWPLGSGHIRLLELRIQIRNLRRVDSRVSSGLVHRMVKNLIELVPLSRVNNGGRVSVHGDAE